MGRTLSARIVCPKNGFNSVQNVASWAVWCPLFTPRKKPLAASNTAASGQHQYVWSQLLSFGGGQFFRGIFLVSEKAAAGSHANGLGQQHVGSYELPQQMSEAGRVTYYFKNGGRIDKDDFELGVVPTKDPGAFDQADIYKVENSTHFCQAVQPSNQTEFGVFGHIGNNFGYKIGESFTPTSQWQGMSGGKYERQTSNQRKAELAKASITFTTRAGFEGSSNAKRSVTKGQQLTYKIYSSSEYEREFEGTGSSSGGEQPSKVTCEDVGTTIASIQRSYDERITLANSTNVAVQF